MNSEKMSRYITAIEREYDLIRQDNVRLLYERKKEIDEKVPGYRELTHKLSRNAMELLDDILESQESFDSRKIRARLEAEKIKEQKEELLLSHGYPRDYLEPVYNCRMCEDTGYLRSIEGARRERCTCFSKKLAVLIAKDSGLSDLLKTENFDNLSEEYYQGDDLKNFRRAQGAVREFARDGGYRNFFFYGNIGTGKSFLSCCAAKEFIDKGREVMYFSAAALFDELARIRQRTVREDDPGNTGMAAAIYDCDLLILDDLGTEWFNSFVFSQFFSLVNERIIKKRSTIISTNLTLKDLSEIYSERLLSRISENYMLCKLTGSDIRMEKVRRGYSR